MDSMNISAKRMSPLEENVNEIRSNFILGSFEARRNEFMKILHKRLTSSFNANTLNSKSKQQSSKHSFYQTDKHKSFQQQKPNPNVHLLKNKASNRLLSPLTTRSNRSEDKNKNNLINSTFRSAGITDSNESLSVKSQPNFHLTKIASHHSTNTTSTVSHHSTHSTHSSHPSTNSQANSHQSNSHSNTRTHHENHNESESFTNHTKSYHSSSIQEEGEAEEVECEEDKRNHVLQAKFERAKKMLQVVLNVFAFHKERMKNFKFLSEFSLQKQPIKAVFAKNSFERSRENFLPQETKRYLCINRDERTEEILKHIVVGLNFAVPEFKEYPDHIQKMLASLANYEEYEPGRVILRQGHNPLRYYIVISGIATVVKASNKAGTDEVVYTPILVLKRGDAFGEIAILNNIKRTSSIIADGLKPVCLLSIDKEDFFQLQSSNENNEKLIEYLKKDVQLLKNLNMSLNTELSKNKIISVYYRNGKIITENKHPDEWLYIVKSGSCKVYAKICLDHKALDTYLQTLKSKRLDNLYKSVRINNQTPGLDKLIKKKHLTIYKEEIELYKRYLSDEKENRYTFFEITRLNSGDIFGLDELFLPDSGQYKCHLILISQGMECVLINRNFFLSCLSDKCKTLLKLRFQPYPDEEYMKNKYFHYFLWRNFSKANNKEIVDKLEIHE